MDQQSLTLSVRLRHAFMLPDEISSSMGVEPTAMHTVGAIRRSPAGKELGGSYDKTYWTYKLLQRADAELEEAIAEANVWLRQRAAFLRKFSESGGGVEYYASVTCNDRFAVELAPDVLGECVHLGVRLSIEIFCG